MGIQGLLKGLNSVLVSNDKDAGGKNKNISSNNIRQFRNQSLAIDASSWLFKAAYSCAERLVESIERCEHTPDPYVERVLCNYMLKRCEELFANASIRQIYLVFDGKRSPLKDSTNQERAKKRRINLIEARRLKQEGMTILSQDKYKACIKVVHWMAQSVHKAVQNKYSSLHLLAGTNALPKVKCVFSPYEADAQLAKLCIDNYTQAVVTEDSDILVYSATCNLPFPIIYKLDRETGSCNVITMDWLLSPSTSTFNDACTTRPSPPTDAFESLRTHLSTQHYPHTNAKQYTTKSKKNNTSPKGPGAALLTSLRAMVTKEKHLPGSGIRMFVQSCILSGCDYAPNQLSGIGPVTSFKLIREHSHRNSDERFFHILKSIPNDKFISNPLNKQISHSIDSYETLLAKCELVFYHHLVYQVSTNTIVPLTQFQHILTLGKHNKNPDTNTNNSPSLTISMVPCTKRFANNLSFLGPELNTNTCDDDGPCKISVKAPLNLKHAANRALSPSTNTNANLLTLKSNAINKRKFSHDNDNTNPSKDNDIDVVESSLGVMDAKKKEQINPFHSFSFQHKSQFQNCSSNNPTHKNLALTKATETVFSRRVTLDPDDVTIHDTKGETENWKLSQEESSLHTNTFDEPYHSKSKYFRKIKTAQEKEYSKNYPLSNNTKALPYPMKSEKLRKDFFSQVHSNHDDNSNECIVIEDIDEVNTKNRLPLFKIDSISSDKTTMDKANYFSAFQSGLTARISPTSSDTPNNVHCYKFGSPSVKNRTLSTPSKRKCTKTKSKLLPPLTGSKRKKVGLKGNQSIKSFFTPLI